MATTSAPLFTLLDDNEQGYDRAEVDHFMALARDAYDSGRGMPLSEIRKASFTLGPGGYNPAEVDSALDRLEDAFAGAERDRYIEQYGEDAWYEQLHLRSQPLRARMERPDGQRFREPTEENNVGYRKDEVDQLCKQLEAYLDGENPMSVDEIRTITFKTAAGNQGYDEAQVDAFLDRMTEIMASVG
ncbi:DivIVA domain-containing protein [Nesterenkonia sp. MY13]|uniref:DivIVA domain-containing protein n=1 Tax=Nesterenkonia sedimenti TaxID=1463632 RepID=A0A7X8YEL0_9MICC|nr:DivIVA domain-containing protein [Nesterenkonia sedimenti]NLS10615.1 DivIVA domain-containing protein [Nesterenkonia sedimenti]